MIHGRPRFRCGYVETGLCTDGAYWVDFGAGRFAEEGHLYVYASRRAHARGSEIRGRQAPADDYELDCNLWRASDHGTPCPNCGGVLPLLLGSDRLDPCAQHAWHTVLRLNGPVYVLLLRTVSGDVDVRLLGVEFKGASGPIIMWILCFLALILAVNKTWDLGNDAAKPREKGSTKSSASFNNALSSKVGSSLFHKGSF